MNYTVIQGDCLSSIGEKYGIPWKKIWNHAENAAFKQARKDPNVLYPGDVLFIPDKGLKEENGSTEQKHKFVKKTDKVWLKVRLLEEDEPRKNLSYTLKFDGKSVTGTTDGDGKLEEEISDSTSEAWIKTDEDVYYLKVGHLDPVEEDSGVAQRLQNLAFLGKDYDDESLSAAIKDFQKKYGLGETGTADDATQSKLKEKHGS